MWQIGADAFAITMLFPFINQMVGRFMGLSPDDVSSTSLVLQVDRPKEHIDKVSRIDRPDIE